MQWIAPTERDVANEALEKRLWDAADQLRANSGLKASEYSGPVLGLIFLRFAEVRFAKRRAELEKAQASSRRASRLGDPTAYNAEGVLYLDPKSRFDYLLNLPEGAPVGSAVNDAMRAIERDNPQLSGMLPKVYEVFTSTLLKEVLKKVSEIPATLDYDAFGRIYEYFLGAFALTEGRGGGEFYTPSSIVRFLVEVLEPFHGRILDPACGSGGMFVQSARFVAEHKHGGTLTPRSALPSPSGRGAGGEGLADSMSQGYTGARYSDTVLFIDARHIFRQLDRAHRDWTPAQIGFLANIARLYRGEEPDFTLGGDEAKANLNRIAVTLMTKDLLDEVDPDGEVIAWFLLMKELSNA